MVIISTSATEVSIHAVSPLLGLALELAGAALAAGAAAVVAVDGVGADPEAAAIRFEAVAAGGGAMLLSCARDRAGVRASAINAPIVAPARRLVLAVLIIVCPWREVAGAWISFAGHHFPASAGIAILPLNFADERRWKMSKRTNFVQPIAYAA
jgi:hypothetical protein